MSDSSNATMNFPRRDARDKLRGRTRYTVDQGRPGMLHAVQLRSEVAAARIVRIDATAARAMPGVRAIVTVAGCAGPPWHRHRRPSAVCDGLHPLRRRADRRRGGRDA